MANFKSRDKVVKKPRKPEGVKGANRTPEKMKTFFKSLCEGWSIVGSCERANLSRDTVYLRRRQDPEFEKAVLEAIDAGTQSLEDVAISRARARSDVLLMFLLNGRNPEKYKRNSKLEVSGAAGGAIRIDAEVDVSKLSDAELTAKYREEMGETPRPEKGTNRNPV